MIGEWSLRIPRGHEEGMEMSEQKTRLRDAINCWYLVKAELDEWERQILEATPKNKKETNLLRSFREFRAADA
jgi:hypothetical protein